MNQMSRRELFSRKGMEQVIGKLPTLFELFEEQNLNANDKELPDSSVDSSDDRTVMANYFSSSIYSYALLSEMPWELLIDEAKRFGIPYEGRSKLDVVRDLFLGTGGKEEDRA